MLICSNCKAVALLFAEAGERCFRKGCKGTFVSAIVSGFTRSDVERNGGMSTDVQKDISKLPMLVDLETNGHENGYTKDLTGLLVEEEAGGQLGDRKQAVKLAVDLLKRRKDGYEPSPDEIAELRASFPDLGQIYRPARGFPDMAKAREQHRGQFFTSTTVGTLMWKLVNSSGVRVLESSIGIGNLIAEPNDCCVTGIDVDRDAVLVSRAILGPRHCVIHDEMQHHQFREEFEVVLGNPPYSVSIRDRRKLWGRTVGWDGWGRGEMVWLEQSALAVKRPGVVIAVLPVGMYEVLLPKFVDWLESKMNLAAEVILPKKEAHVFSQWPVSLYVWVAGFDPYSVLGQGSDENTLPEVEKKVYELLTLESWETSETFRRLCADLSKYLDPVRVFWAKNRHEGPVEIQAWTRPKEEKKKQRVLGKTEEDVVVLRVVNGRLKVTPNGVGAQAKIELIRLEMGQRYDKKQEKHFWRYEEMIAAPALITIGKVAGLFLLYGFKVEVDRQSKGWIKRRRRWYRRQMSYMSRTVAHLPTPEQEAKKADYRRRLSRPSVLDVVGAVSG